MTKRVRVEWLQSHVRNTRGILFLLNKLHVKKESFSHSLSGSPIPDGDMSSPQIFWQCFLLSFENQFLEEDGNKRGFFPGSVAAKALKIEGPIHHLLVNDLIRLNPDQKSYTLLAACFTHRGGGKAHFQSCLEVGHNVIYTRGFPSHTSVGNQTISTSESGKYPSH